MSTRSRTRVLLLPIIFAASFTKLSRTFESLLANRDVGSYVFKSMLVLMYELYGKSTKNQHKS